MKAAERLAKVLREAELFEMAKKAKEGYYGDFTSPLDLPKSELVRELTNAGKEDLALRVIDGEFDDD